METLVLSAGYEPLGRVTWRRAMTLWIGGRVEILEAYGDRVVRTIDRAYPLPAVVRFLRGRRRFRHLIRFSRDNVFLRDKGRCQYCGQEVPRAAATYDHVIPRALGGGASWDNLVVACLPCNQRKAARTPEQAGMRLLLVPGRPRSLPALLEGTLQFDTDMPEVWRSYLGVDGA